MQTEIVLILCGLSICNSSLHLTESTAYQFGHGAGLVTFQYPEGRQPDSRRDLLALGLMTHQEDAVVLRLDSANSNDYLELEIVRLSSF